MHNTKRYDVLLAAILLAVVASACGVESQPQVDGPLRAVEADDDEIPAPTPEPAVTAAAGMVFAIDSTGTSIYALEVQLDDVGSLPIAEPFEASAQSSAHIWVLGFAPYEQRNPLCDELITIPGEDGPCADIVIPALSDPLEVRGTIVLSSSADTITGQVDAFVRNDASARANFAM